MTLTKNSYPLTPLSRLRHGHDDGAPAGVCNVRVSGREDGLAELAASIASVGLLSPLVVVRHEGLAYVADGNRRLAALLRLAAAGTIAEDHEVDVVERDAATAREAGLAANINQVRMHEADQYRTFHTLRQEGMDEAAIASRFGIEPVRIRRMLALGQLADEVLDAWRAGEFARDAVETVRTFTLASSLDEQRAVLTKLRGAGRLYAHCVKNELGVGDHDQRRFLALVGRDAYVASGGGLILDLFGEDHRVEDPALLKRMVDEVVRAEATCLVRDGWSWAVEESHLPDNARWSWQTIRAEPRAGTEAEIARIEELQAIVDADGDADGVAAAEEAIEEIEQAQRLGGYTAEQKARAGVIIRVGRGGSGLDLTLGVIRPATAAVAVAKASAAIEGLDPAAAVKAAKAEQAENVAISAALTLRLSQQRTLAMRDAMIATPHVALAALLASAIAKDPFNAPTRVTVHGYREDQTGIGRGATETYADAFARLVSMPIEGLLVVVAGVAGLSLDLQQQNATAVPSHAKGARALEARLNSEVLGEALRDRWDAADYVKSAPKALSLRAVAEALGQPEADRISGLTKPEIAAVVLARVVPTGWLPPELRPVGYVAPVADAAAPPKPARKKAA